MNTHSWVDKDKEEQSDGLGTQIGTVFFAFRLYRQIVVDFRSKVWECLRFPMQNIHNIIVNRLTTNRFFKYSCATARVLGSSAVPIINHHPISCRKAEICV